MLFNRPDFHNPAIDGVRGLGLLMVLVAHLLHFHSPFFTSTEKTSVISNLSGIFRADLAVDAFFVISGFLIGSILIQEYKKNSSISFKRFYFRRFLRLTPVYFVCVLLSLICHHFMSAHLSEGSVEIEKMVGNFWTNLLYINNFIPIQEQFMGWCWTLAVEEQFYLIAPIFVVFLFRQEFSKSGIFISLLILSCVIRFFVVYRFGLVGERFWGEVGTDDWRKTFSLLYDNLYTRYGGLLIGFFGSYLSICHKNRVVKFFKRINLSKNLYFLSLFGLFLVFFKFDYFYFTDFVNGKVVFVGNSLSFFEESYFCFVASLSRNIFSLCLMYVVFYIMFSSFGKTTLVWKVLSSKILFPISQISYSAYLIHPLIMVPTFYFTTQRLLLYTDSLFVVFLINSVISLLLIFFLSFLLYVFVEKPFMRMRNNRFFKQIGV